MISLKDIISKKPFDRVGQITFPTIDATNDVETNAAQLEAFLEKTISFRKDLQEKPSCAKAAKNVVLGWFRASYPFANLVLSIAKDSVQVLIPS